MWRKPFPEAYAGTTDGSDLSSKTHTASDRSSQGQRRDVCVLPAEDVLSVFTDSSAIQNESANIKRLETVLYQHLRQMVDMKRMLITTFLSNLCKAALSYYRSFLIQVYL